MNVYGFRFKRTLEECVHLAGLRLREFRAEYQVDGFFAESIRDDDPPAEIAAKALRELCVEDGKFNGCTTALKAILAFLHAEASQAPQAMNDCAACLQELKHVLAGPECTSVAIADWIGRWFKF